MKTRFNTFDIICSVTELQRLVGMRVSNVYDVDNKTYLIKLQRTEEKSILLIESGNRFHTSAFEWPKNVAPSGFSMKMRKHLRNKRLECLKQLGVDRIVDFQFGSGEAAYHVILELYDRGNIVLTDYELTILNVLRPHTEGETVRFAVKEKYPTNRAKEKTGPLTIVELTDALKNAKQGESLKKLLNPILVYGPAIIDHVLLSAGFTSNCKLGKGFIIDRDVPKLLDALKEADKLLDSASEHVSKGYIIQKKEERPSTDVNEKEYIFTNQEFHPMLFTQHGQSPYREFPTFDTAVDEFFSTFEGQKIDMRALQQEREALKKLENVRKDHAQRLVALEQTQENDKQKAELITKNQVLVDNAILAIRSAIANQLSWPDIQTLVLQAAESGDSVASTIKQFKLEMNHISLLLGDPFAKDDEADEDAPKPILIDIDLGTSAFGNARKYYDQKRTAAKKQQKTVESHGKALKSAEKKTKQTLKEVQAITNINKARKVYWFEKFFWFVSSENFLVIGGRDQQQNELIVKRYMRPGDVYVHADVHGASSVIVKNPSTEPVPPKTLNEAGTMAICYSVAWEAKVITSAWWVHSNQVSKTAPTGEYLTTGSFMVRGKKNYLPPCHLIMGLSFLFKLDDACVERHRNERRVRTVEEETIESLQRVTTDVVVAEEEDDEEIELESEGESRPTDDPLGKEDDVRAESDSGDDMKFPDTHIKIEHFTETKIDIKMESKTPILMRQSGEDVIYLGDNEPIFLKPSSERPSGRSRGESKSKDLKKNTKEESECGSNTQQQSQPKRGQKGKLKKIKEKYKDQDEEERAMRMKILQSAGAAKEGKKTKKKDHRVMVDRCKRKAADREPKVPQSRVPDGSGVDEQLGADDDKEEIVVNADVDMLDSLTGNPFPDDEILFAIPVVAPYNTLQNYKYKVKLMPGTGRRGKASKTAVSIFLQERMTTQREKDLLRSVKDENIARNLPGKVKLSAPKLQNVKKQSNFIHRS